MASMVREPPALMLIAFVVTVAFGFGAP